LSSISLLPASNISWEVEEVQTEITALMKIKIEGHWMQLWEIAFCLWKFS
jgi:hypothetical protein